MTWRFSASRTRGMNRIEHQIRARVEAFIDELTRLIKQAALESASQTRSRPRAAPVRRQPVRGRKQVKRRQTKPPLRRHPALKRETVPQGLEQLNADLYEEILLNPGQRIEEIAKTLEVTTKEINVLVKGLLAANRIKKRGRGRATTYYAV